MVFVTLLVWIAFSVGTAKKCDVYVVGSVYHHTQSDDLTASFQGCKKGCYFNKSFTDDGVRTCGKCSEIEDELECRKYTSTCQWTKSGKCRSQSCPSIAKTRVAVSGSTSGNFLDDTSSNRTEVYRIIKTLENECISGSALENEHANRYFEDYKAKINLKYVQDNCPRVAEKDACYGPSSWNFFEAGNSANGTKAYCERTGRFGSYKFTGSGSSNGVINLNGADKCELIAGNYSCSPWIAGTNNKKECQALSGCTYYGGDPGDGSRLNASDNCYAYVYSGYWGRCHPFTAGTNTRTQCENLGCIYQGVATCTKPCGYFNPGTHTRSTCEGFSFGNCKYIAGAGNDGTFGNLDSADKCVPRAGIYDCSPDPFSQENCEAIGCTYGYRSSELSYCTIQLSNDAQPSQRCYGYNFPSSTLSEFECRSLGCVYTGEDAVTTSAGQCGTYQTKCDIANKEFGETYLGNYQCNINSSLSIGAVSGMSTPAKLCQDRVYDNIPKTVDPGCRDETELPDLKRQKCIFDEKELLSEVVHVNGVTKDENGVNIVKGDLRPGTKREFCIEQQMLIKDPFAFKPIVGVDTGGSNYYVDTGGSKYYAKYVADDISDANRKILYGFSTADEYCDHEMNFNIENCEETYRTDVEKCASGLTYFPTYSGSVSQFEINPTNLRRTHVQIMAERETCHRIYGCMYSRSNERCSVWAVWAYILCLVLSILVFVCGILVLGFFLVNKGLKKVGPADEPTYSKLSNDAVDNSLQEQPPAQAPAATPAQPPAQAPAETPAPPENTAVVNAPANE